MKVSKKRSWLMKLRSSEESGAIPVTSQNSLNTWRRFHPLSRTSSTGWWDRQSSWRGTFCIRTRKVSFISLYQNNNQSLMWRATPGSVNEAEKRGALPEVLHCGQVRQLWIQFIKWIISILSGSTCLSSRLTVSGCWSHRVCVRHWLPTSILQSHYAKNVRNNDC